MQKMTMQTRQNAICWNPMEPFHFTTASEDHDLYTFDMRRLDHAICVHKGCVSAALTLDPNPNPNPNPNADPNPGAPLHIVGEGDIGTAVGAWLRLGSG